MAFDLYFACISSTEYGATKFLYNQYDDRSKIQNMYEYLNDSAHKVFLDSGAYPAFTRGVKLDIDDYINYINKISNIVSVVASLDVIPQSGRRENIEDAAKQSWNNYIYMRDKVSCKEKLVPTFHQTEPMQYLQNMLESDADYIALGAMANTIDSTSRTSFIAKCFDMIMKIRPDIKVHAFGMTDLNILEMFPFYSADSTAYVLAAGMGEIITKFGRVAVSNLRYDNHKLSTKSTKNFEVIAEYVAEFGYDIVDLAKSRDERIKFNISYLQQWERNRVCKYSRGGLRQLF